MTIKIFKNMKIKKRVIMAAVIAVFALVQTHRFWLVFEPLFVSFDMKGDGKYFVSVLINRKDNDEFKKIRTANEEFLLHNKSENLKFTILSPKRSKRIKFEISSKTGKNPKILIGGIKVNDKKINTDNLENFDIQGAEAQIENGKLALNPIENNISIIYNKTFDIKPSVIFDFKLLIIILILTYFAAYKLADYMADLKTRQGKSMLDICFLSVFFVSLFIPMHSINKNEISQTENRKLAEWQPFVTSMNRINYDFGKNFDEWFNDRFFGRYYLTAANSNLRMIFSDIYKTDSAVYDKKYNLLYTSSFYGFQPDNNSDFNKQKENIVNNLARLNEYCNSRNIKLYLLIVPRGSNFIEHTILNLKAEKKDYAEDIIKSAQDKGLNIIYPKEAMMKENERTPVYFKTDHHWSKAGTYIGYYELMKEIKKDFPSVKILERSELKPFYSVKVSEHWNKKLHNGQTFNLLAFPQKTAEKILDTEYEYYKNPYEKFLKWKALNTSDFVNKEDCIQDDYFYYPEGADKKVLIIGNSFSKNLVSFLPYSFKYIVRFHDNFTKIERKFSMKYYKPFIDEYKPDILILNFHTSYIYNLNNMYKEQE